MTATDWTKWLGRQAVSSDTFTQNMLSRIAATLNTPTPPDGTALPLLWHWCFFQQTVGTDELAVDGHPVPGDFLPPAHGRQRMWAGGRLEFIRPFIAGKTAGRCSTIKAVEEKHGRNGSLLFVTVLHEYSQDGELVVQEEQDIVYREPSPPKLSSQLAPAAADWREEVDASEQLLFRYSAITFNTHRIHYDWPYATEQEGYPGLVVHGPLMATLLVKSFVEANPMASVLAFSFRGVRPLIAGEVMEVGGVIQESGVASLWSATGAGIGQEGTIRFSHQVK